MAPATIQVKRYGSPDEFQKDAQKLARQGWSVTAQSEETQRTGCMRFVMLGGVGALIFKPKPRLVVTYTRTA